MTAASNRGADFLFRDAERIISHDCAATDKLDVAHTIEIFHRVAYCVLREFGIDVVNVEFDLLERCVLRFALLLCHSKRNSRRDASVVVGALQSGFVQGLDSPTSLGGN